MTDPLKQIRDELGVCTEEALFYLEGFGWDLNAAMEACRNKTLPSPAQPPSSENERAAAEERRRNERAAAEEHGRNEKISKFRQVASGSSREDAQNYLSRSNWDIDHAVSSFFDDRFGPPKKKSNPPPVSHDGHTAPPRFSWSKGSDVLQDVLSKVPQFRNASTNLRTANPPSASTPPPLELTQESITQFRDFVSEASPPAVLDCLNHCKGNVTDAIDYFYGTYSKARSGIATAVVVKDFSGMTVDQDSKTESLPHVPEAKPLVAAPSQVEESGNPTETLLLKGEEPADEVKEEAAQPPSSEKERAAAEEHRSNEKKIEQFLQVAAGSSAEDAVNYLSRSNWNIDHAAMSFYDDTEKKSNPPPVADDLHTVPWYQHGFSGDLGSDDVMQDVLSKVPQFHSALPDLKIGSPPSASTPPFELKQESINQFHDIASLVPAQAAIDCLNHCKGDVTAAIQYYYDVYSKEELIASFSSVTGGTRQVANVYLSQDKWNLDVAISNFFDHSMGLPSQSQFDASYVSSGSTETQRSLEEAGEGDVTVAIPGMASSSQVDGKAVEEGSSAETVPNPSANRDRTTVETQAAPSTIMVTIYLSDGLGTTMELPFRSNQTLRDIRNAIDQRYPDNDRGYFLQSLTGEDYMDWSISVYRVSSGGYTSLLQTYP